MDVVAGPVLSPTADSVRLFKPVFSLRTKEGRSSGPAERASSEASTDPPILSYGSGRFDLGSLLFAWAAIGVAPEGAWVKPSADSPRALPAGVAALLVLACFLALARVVLTALGLAGAASGGSSSLDWALRFLPLAIFASGSLVCRWYAA